MVFYVRPQPVTSRVTGMMDSSSEVSNWHIPGDFKQFSSKSPPKKKWGKLQWMWSICMGWWLDRFRLLRWNYPYFLDLPHLLFSACALTWRLLMCEHGHGWEIGEPNGHLWDSHRTKGGMGRHGQAFQRAMAMIARGKIPSAKLT